MFFDEAVQVAKTELANIKLIHDETEQTITEAFGYEAAGNVEKVRELYEVIDLLAEDSSRRMKELNQFCDKHGIKLT